MHRPLGRAGWLVYAPFAFAVARLTRPLAWSLAHLPAWVGGRAGLVACPSIQALSPIPDVFFQAGKAGFGFQSVSRVGLACSGQSHQRCLCQPALATPPIFVCNEEAEASLCPLAQTQNHS